MKFRRQKQKKTLETGCQTNKAYFVWAESLNDEEKSFLENIKIYYDNPGNVPNKGRNFNTQ